MSGATPLLPLYVCLVWAGTALPSYSTKFFLGQVAASGYEGSILIMLTWKIG